MSKFKKVFFCFKIKKWPSRSQWKCFLKVLNKKEKIFFFVFLFLTISSTFFLLRSFYLKNTQIQPTIGGTHIEGVIGQPRFINPIYANSDVDRDLVELLFSGLMKYKGEGLEIVPDLVEKYEVEQDGRVYKFYLKKNLFWSDGQPLTADDVVFTIKTIQNPNYKSPLMANWIGIEVEKISDLGVEFRISKPYSAFLENCTVKILPKHIWKNISPENFPLDINNLNAVGSGPYKIKEIKRDKQNLIESIVLNINPFYSGKKPYIPTIKFLFFSNKEELIKAAKKEKIKGFSLSYFEKINDEWKINFLQMPRYFAVFFNPEKSEFLKEEKFRKALNFATNKEEIISKVLKISKETNTKNFIVNSPILPRFYNLSPPEFVYSFDLEKAKQLLDELDLKDENGDGFREKIIKEEAPFQFKSELKKGSKGKEVEELQKCLAKDSSVYPEGEITGYFGKKTEEAVIKFQEKYKDEILTPWGFTKGTGIVSKTTRKKLNEICFSEKVETLPLKISLATVDQEEMLKIANILKNYQALLFGEILGAIPDPFPFWHSSQIRDPGLNLAIYENKKADQFLEKARKSLSLDDLFENLVSFQNILIKDAPVVFLYNPGYIYYLSGEIKTTKIQKIIDPSKRFSDIENWYIKTKRVWQ